jgi:hypothetical protein
MTGKEAVALSGRSETWLRNHECAWCGQTLWRALNGKCGAVFDRCDPSQKDFSANGKMPVTSGIHNSKTEI